MALMDNDIIPVGVDWLDEYREDPGIYVYADADEAVIGICGLDNVVELIVDASNLSRLIDELTSAEESITRDV